MKKQEHIGDRGIGYDGSIEVKVEVNDQSGAENAINTATFNLIVEANDEPTGKIVSSPMTMWKK